MQLMLAITQGNKSLVQRLLANGVNVNETSKDGETPLMTAAASGQRDITMLLLEQGAKANVRSTRGLTPLSAAAMGGHEEVVEVLLPHITDKQAILRAAGDAETLGRPHLGKRLREHVAGSCPFCGKPLRSSGSKRCFECGKNWQNQATANKDDPEIAKKAQEQIVLPPEEKIHFHCPKCKAPISAPREATGKRGKCPKCRSSVMVP